VVLSSNVSLPPQAFSANANGSESGIRRAQATLDCPCRKVSDMQKSLETAELASTLFALQEHLETVRQTELERVRRRQVSFRREQHDAMEELTRGIVARILQGPVKVLEAASDDEEPAALLSMVHRLFNLGDKTATRQHQHR